MTGISVRLFSFGRCAIRLHVSWIVVAGVVWGAESLRAGATFGWEAPWSYLAGLAVAVGVMASAIVQEIAVVRVAQRGGLDPREATVWFFGGTRWVADPPASPRAEMRMGLAAVLARAALAGGLAVVAATAARTIGWTHPVSVIAGRLAVANGVLLLLNLVPCCPLAGGDLLHAWAWRRTASFSGASAVAWVPSRVFPALVVAVMAVQAVLVTGAGGSPLPGFAFVAALIAGVIVVLAREQQRRWDAVGGTCVAALVHAVPPVASGEAVTSLLARGAAGRAASFYPVVQDGAVVGLLCSRALAAMPPTRRDRVLVDDVMLRLRPAAIAAADTPLLGALRSIRKSLPLRIRLAPLRWRDLPAVVLDDDGRLLGLVEPRQARLQTEVLVGHQQKPVPGVKPGARVWVATAVVAAVGAAAFVRPAWLIVAPGHASSLDVALAVRGPANNPPRGRYLATSVQVIERPTLLAMLAAGADSTRTVLPARQLPGVSPARFARRDASMHAETISLASIAAARAVGEDATVTGTGALVYGVVPGSPADGVLRPDDVIVALDNGAVTLAPRLVAALDRLPLGSEVALRIERRGRLLDLVVRTAARRSRFPDLTAVGAYVETRDLAVRVPFHADERDVALRNSAGPSAGLAFALHLVDELDAGDHSNGWVVAATGTIGENGEVGPIAGVAQKAITVRRAGGQVFLVPKANLPFHPPPGLRVIGVSGLQEAMAELGRLGPAHSARASR